jgi:hypothetical protein
MLLQSLKKDIELAESAKEKQKPFTVRTFDLGRDVLPDREEIYISRRCAELP